MRRWLPLLIVAVTTAAYFAPPDRCSPWPSCKRKPSTSISPSPSPVGKGIPKGLSTSGFSSPFYTSRLTVATLNVYWDQIEPTQGAKTIDPVLSVLDQAQAAGIYSVRIRPYLGVRAPPWAKALGQGPIAYIEPQSGKSHTVPDIWSLEYQRAVESLVRFLASHLDIDPRVRLVFATGAMLAFGEPFIRGTSNAENRAAFLAAGYTKDIDAALERWQVSIMGVFQLTPVGLAYNPWQYVNLDGTAGSSVTFMAEVMDYHISLFGSRAVLTNHSIRSSFIASPPPMYAAFRARPGVAHQFQTAASSRIGDLRATLDWGIDYLDASVIEVYPGAWDLLTDTEIHSYDQRLAGNP